MKNAIRYSVKKNLSPMIKGDLIRVTGNIEALKIYRNHLDYIKEIVGSQYLISFGKTYNEYIIKDALHKDTVACVMAGDYLVRIGDSMYFYPKEYFESIMEPVEE